jgi:hypothetical protein
MSNWLQPTAPNGTRDTWLVLVAHDNRKQSDCNHIRHHERIRYFAPQSDPWARVTHENVTENLFFPPKWRGKKFAHEITWTGGNLNCRQKKKVGLRLNDFLCEGTGEVERGRDWRYLARPVTFQLGGRFTCSWHKQREQAVRRRSRLWSPNFQVPSSTCFSREYRKTTTTRGHEENKTWERHFWEISRHQRNLKKEGKNEKKKRKRRIQWFHAWWLRQSIDDW